MTPAEIKVEADSIHLSQGGKSMTLYILDLVQAKIVVEEASALQKPRDAENPGIKRVSVHTSTEPHARGGFRILAVPGSSELVKPTGLQGLESWE